MNVLVIEDERKLADAIVRILTDAGYNAEATYDGQSGLTYAESGLYDLIVLDRMLPGMDGIELLRNLRHEKNSTPVLMLTARTSTEDKVEGLDAGADDYLTKPFESAEFLARVRALGRRQGGAEGGKGFDFDRQAFGNQFHHRRLGLLPVVAAEKEEIPAFFIGVDILSPADPMGIDHDIAALLLTINAA